MFASILSFSTPVGIAENSTLDVMSNSNIIVGASIINDATIKYKQEIACLEHEILLMKLEAENKAFMFQNVYNNIGVDLNINPQIISALQNYNGPEITITSGRRLHGPKYSDHYTGSAIDISWRDNGKQFLTWLDTSVGKY